MSDQPQTVDVPGTVHQLKQQVAHLEKDVLAYGDLMRGTNPIVSWTTRSTDDRPLEIQTDLGAIPAPTALREAMAQTHADGIRQGLNNLQGLVAALQNVMALPLVEAPALQAPQPSVSIVPDAPVEPSAAQPLQPAPLPLPLEAQALPPVAPGTMAGPAAPNVLPVPPAPAIQQQVSQTGETLVPPRQGGPSAS